MFCRHDWQVLSEITTTSIYEHAIKAMRAEGVTGSISLPWQLCDGERKFIQIISCSKCGKLKRFVETI